MKKSHTFSFKNNHVSFIFIFIMSCTYVRCFTNVMQVSITKWILSAKYRYKHIIYSRVQTIYAVDENYFFKSRYSILCLFLVLKLRQSRAWAYIVLQLEKQHYRQKCVSRGQLIQIYRRKYVKNCCIPTMAIIFESSGRVYQL